jgi:hypothetical protein
MPPATPSPSVARLLDLCNGLTEAEFAELALLCADQAGLSVAKQDELEKALAEVA